MSLIKDFSDLIPIINVILEDYKAFQQTIDIGSSSTNSSNNDCSSIYRSNCSSSGGGGGAVRPEFASLQTFSTMSELDFVTDRLLRLHEWYEDADNVPLMKQIKQRVLDQSFDLPSTLQSIKTFASKSWSKADIDKCVKRKFKAPSSNKYMNFDFNSIPDFEPLEFTLRSLRTDPGNINALKKICNMDFAEFVEHPQWEELLSLTGKALLASDELATIESLKIHAKLLVSFSGVQYMHVCLNLLNHFHTIWCNSKELTYGRCDEPRPGIIQKLLQIDMPKQLISTLLLVVHTLPTNTISASEKFVDTAIATLFLVLSHGCLEIEYEDDYDNGVNGGGSSSNDGCDGVESESCRSSRNVSIKISILDIILPQLLKSESIKKLINTWPLLAIVSHAIHSSFIHVLLQKTKYALSFSLLSSPSSSSSLSSSERSGDIEDEDEEEIFEVTWRTSYYISVIYLFLSIIETATSNTALLKVLLISLPDLMKPIDRSVEDADRLVSYHPYDMYWDGKMELKAASFGSLLVLMQPIEELNRRHYQLSGARLNPYELLNKDHVLDNSNFTGAMYVRFCCDEEPEAFFELLAENLLSKISVVSWAHFPYLLKLLESVLVILLKRSPALHDSFFPKVWTALIKLCMDNANSNLFDTLEFSMRHMTKMNQSSAVSSIDIYVQILLDISDIIFSNHYFLNPFYSYSSFEPRLLHILDLYFCSWLRLMSWSQMSDTNWSYRCEVWSKLTQLNLSSRYPEVSMEGNVCVLKEVFDFSIAICRNIEARLAKLSKRLGKKNVSVMLANDDDDDDDDDVENASTSDDCDGNSDSDIDNGNDDSNSKSRCREVKGAGGSTPISTSISDDGVEDSENGVRSKEGANTSSSGGNNSSSNNNNEEDDKPLPDMKFVLTMKLFCSRVLDFICQYCKDFSNCSLILRKDPSVFTDTLRILTRVISLNVTEESSSDTSQLFSLYFNNIDVVGLEQAYTMLLNCLSVLNADELLPKDLYKCVLEDFSIVISYLELRADAIFDMYVSEDAVGERDEFIKCFANVCRAFIVSGYYSVMVTLWSTEWTPLVEIAATRSLNFTNFSFYLENMGEDLFVESVFPLFDYIFVAALANSSRTQTLSSVLKAGYSLPENDLFAVSEISEQSIHIKDFYRVFRGDYHVKRGFLTSLSPISSDTELADTFTLLESGFAATDVLSEQDREYFAQSISSILTASAAAPSPTARSMYSEFEVKFDEYFLAINSDWPQFLAKNGHYRHIIDDLVGINCLLRSENLLTSAPSQQVTSFVAGMELLCHELSVESMRFADNVFANLMILALSLCDSKMKTVGLVCHLIDGNINLEVLKMDRRNIRLFLFDEVLQFDDARLYISMVEALFLNLISVHPLTALIDRRSSLDVILRYIVNGPDAVLQLIANIFDHLKTSGLKSRNCAITCSNAYAVMRKACTDIE